MEDQLILSKNDLIEIIEHHLGKFHYTELICIINQFTNSWVEVLPNTNKFVWTGGERPSYLTSVVKTDLIQKVGLDNRN